MTADGKTIKVIGIGDMHIELTNNSNVLFDAIRKVILAEFNHSGESCPDQSHVMDKISAIKWKGKPPHFSK